MSHLSKVLYPAAGFTKAQVLDYYARVGTALIPHLRGRPLTLLRAPSGVAAPAFYEKNAPSHRPPWVKTAAVHHSEVGPPIHYLLCDDLPTLVWIANLAGLELHPSLSLARRLEQPRVVVFDLDPGAPAELAQCCQVAMALKALFDALGLAAFPKTSGGKGLQVYLPLNTPVTYGETKAFARQVAEALAARQPSLVVAKMPRALRTGKVFVDWSQNDVKKTTVSVYSLRVRERPTVSAPVTWGEVEQVARGRRRSPLVFEAGEALARVERDGDLFAPVLTLKQRLPRGG